MKAWYDDIDNATLQRIKTYSAFNDATSKNLMIQTMYEYREKEIQDFKETNHELAETCIERKRRIDELEKENAKLKKRCDNYEMILSKAERYKPKWHNVAGGDLPPEDTKVLALMADNEICIAHFYRINVWDKIGTVIAWCEIPEYTEE